LAAMQGVGSAQWVLGMMYQSGEGLPQDFVQAHMWFNLAAANADSSFAKGRETVAMLRDSLATLMTPDQIAEAQTLARNWKPKKMEKSNEQWLGNDIR
jgi:TPR repeat protein